MSSQGNPYILTIRDYFSKFVEAVPLPSKNADGVSNVLFKVYYCINYVISMIANRLTHNQIFMRMRIPKVLTSYNGSEFRNDLVCNAHICIQQM